MKLVFFGTPTPKQSARFRGFMKGKKIAVQSYQTTEVKNKQKAKKVEAMSQIPDDHELYDVAIGVKVLFVFPPLKSWKKDMKDFYAKGGKIYKDTKPDLHDNLMKMVFDAMEKVVFTNDSRVAKVESEKIYGPEPRTEIQFYELPRPWIT
jgi:Holliday junction resolvase RusA-like endonuclease